MTRTDQKPTTSPLEAAHTASGGAGGDAPAAIVFERLLPRYQRRFGGPPPVTSGDVEEVTRLMRRRLAGEAAETAH